MSEVNEVYEIGLRWKARSLPFACKQSVFRETAKKGSIPYDLFVC